jgi:hypothetical protein
VGHPILNILISIEAGNSNFIVESSFIVDSSRSKLIRYFGYDNEIMIPCDAEILCSSCFSNCKSLLSVLFESSSLSRIQSATFDGAHLNLVLLPESGVFIPGDVFPCSCDVGIANIDSYQELKEWNEGRRSGSREAFEQH